MKIYRSVPPVAVEFAVSKSKQLGKKIEPGVKNQKESAEPDDVVRHGHGKKMIEKLLRTFFNSVFDDSLSWSKTKKKTK